MSLSIREALWAARERFPDPASASLEAQLLLAEVLGVERAYLLAHPEQHLSAEQVSAFAQLSQRRALGEPIAYILGRQAFYDGELQVSSAVLIPRPETEQLVERALSLARAYPAPLIADIGTGSGAIAVTLARHLPHAQVYACDISPQALSLARANAQAQAASLSFFEGDLATPLIQAKVRVNLLCANLPYLTTEEWQSAEVSRHEPRLALESGADGLDAIRALLAQAPQVCAPSAHILLEIGAGQATAVTALAQALHPHSTQVHRDYAGHDRIVEIAL